MSERAPNVDSLRMAATWIESNEGAERAEMLPVAAWLRRESDRRELERLARRVNKSHGCGMAAARRRIRTAAPAGELARFVRWMLERPSGGTP